MKSGTLNPIRLWCDKVSKRTSALWMASFLCCATHNRMTASFIPFLFTTNQHCIPFNSPVICVKATLAFAAHGQDFGYREAGMQQGSSESIPG